eukprot:11472860-Karenia_brevis.AAC.1
MQQYMHHGRACLVMMPSLCRAHRARLANADAWRRCRASQIFVFTQAWRKHVQQQVKNAEAINVLEWSQQPSVLGNRFDLLRTALRRPLTIGSHCTGWSSEGMALEQLGIPHSHAFACDAEPSVERLLKSTYDIGVFFRDMLQQTSIDLAPSVDLYVCGWACQPHSRMGTQDGFDDPRSLVVDKMLDYLAQKLPRCFVLENVPAVNEGQQKP